jgi:hypothetical protein
MMTVTHPSILMTLVAQHRMELLQDAEEQRRVVRGRHRKGRH